MFGWFDLIPFAYLYIIFIILLLIIVFFFHRPSLESVQLSEQKLHKYYNIFSREYYTSSAKYNEIYHIFTVFDYFSFYIKFIVINLSDIKTT